MNFFKLYIGDYQRDTAHLSIAEHGAYMLMLQHYYATEKPLPSGKALHRMLRAQDKTEREAIDSVATQFWLTTDDGLVNDRADVEITKAAAQADTNARIAREREDRRKAARKPNEQSTNRATNGQPNQTADSSVPNGTGGEPPDKPSALTDTLPLTKHTSKGAPTMSIAASHHLASSSENLEAERNTRPPWPKAASSRCGSPELSEPGASVRFSAFSSS